MGHPITQFATMKRFVAKNGLDNNGNTLVNVADPVNPTDASNLESQTAAILVETNRATTAEGLLVPKTTTVNGHALSNNVIVSASDVGLGNVNNLSAINVPLTGYVSNTGTLIASDTILTAIEKLNGNIDTVASGGIASVAIASSNGFAGNSSGGNTPAITLSTPISGILKGDNGALTAATLSDVIAVLNNTLPLVNGNISSATLTTTTTDANQIVDAFLANTYRSVKYHVQITSGAEYQVAELMCVHDDSIVYMTEVADIFTGATILATFEAVVSTGTFQLLVTPTNANTTIKVLRIAIVI